MEKTKTVTRKKPYSILIIATVLTAIITTPIVYVYASSLYMDLTIPSATQESYTYMIFKAGSIIYARNGKTGAIDYSGTNAREIITNAFSKLTSGRNWKEKVILKGNFTIHSPLLLPSYLILQIDGKITLNDSVNDDVIKNKHQGSGQGDTDIDIIGGELDGNGAQQTSGLGINIKGDACTRISIIGVYIHDCKQAGIDINSAGANFPTKVVINNCILVDNYHGMTVRAIDSIIEGNIANSNAKSGIYIMRGYDIMISNNIANDNEDWDGISNDFGCNLTITNNLCCNNHRYGIYDEGEGGHHVFANNICNENGDQGIRAQSDYSIICGNIAKGNGHHGIQFDGDHSIISNNLCHYNSRDGIFGAPTAGNGTISGNVCMNNDQSGAGYYGIEVTSNYVLVSANRCGDSQANKTQDYGIRCNGASYCYLFGNDCRGNEVGGILDGGTGNNQTNNLS